jgi:ABC-2 type transport system permease protein
MDFQKFLNIALKDIRILFQDRATLVIILVAPFALTLVLGAAFGGISTGDDSPIKDIPVVVVNQDKGAMLATQALNFGDRLSEALQQVGGLLKVEVLTDEEQARARVRDGKAVTAVLIPADFSQSLNPANPTFGDTKIRLTLFRDPGSAISADIVNAVVRQILNGFTNADVAIYSAGKANANPLFLITQAGAIAQDVATHTQSGDAPITVMTAQTTPGQSGPGFNLLAFFAPSMAVFFLNFAMAFGVVTILEEKDNGTLQRLIVSPTRRMTILAGKLGGTYVSGVIQIALLIVATSLVAPLLGSKTSIWGTNVPALVVLTLCVVAGALGLGTILAAVARTRQQASIYASAGLVLMGIVGGSFFVSGDRPPMGIASQLTVNYWANSAYARLSQTNDLVSVLPNIAALLVIFVVCFGVGVYLFNRRLDV